MTTTLNARNLTLDDVTLDDVHRLFNLQEQANGIFASLLALEAVSEAEIQDLMNIRDDFRPYLRAGKMSEGVVKAMTIFPLLRLAGFYRPPVRLSIEEGIAVIEILDEDTRIIGRFDILALNFARKAIDQSPFWILVIEAKEGLTNVWAGLPQLLTYAHTSLKSQSAVWGLVANGLNYQFVHLQAGDPAAYQIMPMLNLIESDDLSQLLQVLKAICKLEFSV
jgi:hypothetical protein